MKEQQKQDIKQKLFDLREERIDFEMARSSEDYFASVVEEFENSIKVILDRE